MKKTILLSVLAASAMTMSAQNAIVPPTFCQNWSIGVDGGVTTPMVNYPFFGSMRGMFGMHIAKQVTPVLGLGVEGQATVNTSSWTGIKSPTAIDASYVGTYGTVNLMNLFGGYPGAQRAFAIDAVAGAGWGHAYRPESQGPDHNFFATKAGLNFNFNVSPSVTITLQPAVIWDMSDAGVSQTSAAYNAEKATFNFTAGLTWKIGGENFVCEMPYNQAQIDALNGQINDLRTQLARANENTNTWQNRSIQLQRDLDACNSRAPQTVTQTVVETVEQTNNFYNTVRYVFFKIGSAVITNDQMPNVEQIASYMKNHPDATVSIKGYASQDGPEEVNIRLANQRAAAVKTALVNKYGIDASRIQAEGQGIGHMFDEESWNRVSICVIQAE